MRLRARLGLPGAPVLLVLLLACPSAAAQASGSSDAAVLAAAPALAFVPEATRADVGPAAAAALDRQAKYMPPPASTPAQVAYVSQPAQGNATSLLAALRDPAVTHIVLLGSYDVRDEFDQQLHIPISRNITITGLHGTDDVLDLQYKRSKVELCGTCTLAFVNVTLAGERRGNGSPIDFVLGKPGSRVLVRSCVKRRRACTAARDTAGVVATTPRSKLVMLRGPKDQVIAYADVTFEGKQYPANLVLLDYSVDQPYAVQEGRGTSGGVAQSEVATLRLCAREAQRDCLEAKSPDACVNMLIDGMLDEERAASGGAGPKGAVIAAVVVPIVVLALLAAAAALWWRRRRRGQQAHGPLLGPNGTTPSKDLEAAWADAHGLRPDEEYPSMGERPGWQLIRTLAAPSLGKDPDTNVLFGDLLGQGSFGRVYRARWTGRDVAVKVIPHAREAMASVDNEVSLMLSFEHPHVVRAFLCMTFVGVARSHSGAFAPGGGQAGSGSQGGGWSSRSAASPGLVSQRSMCSSTSAGSDRAARLDGAPGSAQKLAAAAAAATCTQQAAEQQQQQQHALGGLVTKSRGAASVGDTMQDTTTSCNSLPSGELARANRAETWLVMEFCDVGTLWQLCSSDHAQQQWQQNVALRRLQLLQDAARGLKLLHDSHVCHGDLNARNVLVSHDGGCESGMVAKLADLGLSRMIKQHATHRTTETVGTMSHCPPELLTSGRMSPAGDVYAFGIMMWEVYTGQAAFRRMHFGAFFEAIVLRRMRPIPPAGMPADYALLMQWCWATSASMRPSMDVVIEVLDFMTQQQRLQQTDPQRQLLLHPRLQDRAAAQAADVAGEDPGGGGDADAAADADADADADAAAAAAVLAKAAAEEEADGGRPPQGEGGGTQCTDSAASRDVDILLKRSDTDDLCSRFRI